MLYNIFLHILFSLTSNTHNNIIHNKTHIAVRSSLSSMQGRKFSLRNMIKENGIMSVYDGLGKRAFIHCNILVGLIVNALILL